MRTNSAYNYYWNTRLRSWKHLFASKYDEFEEADIEDLANELSRYDKSNYRSSIFYLYRYYFPQATHNEDEYQVHAGRGTGKISKLKQKLWESQDIFSLDDEEIKALVVAETKFCARSSNAAWEDWISAFGGRASDWKEIKGDDTIEKVLQKRVAFYGYNCTFPASRSLL